MIPSKLDVTFWRGSTFALELIAQVKVYNYDPATHIGVADLKRTHLENLEHYGFKYEYVDFATLYTGATFKVMKPWVKAGQAPTQALMELNLTSGITLTDKSVKIDVSATDTKAIDFDSGNYSILLSKAVGVIDCLVQGSVTVGGDK